MMTANGMTRRAKGRILRIGAIGGQISILALCWTPQQVRAAEPVPEITDISYASNNVHLVLSNLATGGTYYVESTGHLASNDWMEIEFFEGLNGATNWSQALDGSETSAFYRVVRETYHAKVGETAILTTRHHGVEGTAHIVNNRTIELRNFYFDGGGLDVVVFVSPNPYPSFSGGTTISGNLVGPPFVDETIQFTLPEGFDLSSVSYISIWCIDIPVSFGDGQFF